MIPRSRRAKPPSCWPVPDPTVPIDFIPDFPEYGSEKKPEKERRWVRAGTPDEIPRGKIRRYVLAGVPVAVFNRDGRLTAARDRCPHMGADLSMGKIEGDVVVCAWHEWRFSLDDGRSKKDWACLELYPIRSSDDGGFEVEVPAESPGS